MTCVLLSVCCLLLLLPARLLCVELVIVGGNLSLVATLLSLVVVSLKSLLAFIGKCRLLDGVFVVVKAGVPLDNSFGIGRTHDVN